MLTQSRGVLLCAYTPTKGWNLYICGASIVGVPACGHYGSKTEAKAAAKALGATPYNY